MDASAKIKLVMLTAAIVTPVVGFMSYVVLAFSL